MPLVTTMVFFFFLSQSRLWIFTGSWGFCQLWWLRPIILAHERLRQEFCEFTWCIESPVNSKQVLGTLTSSPERKRIKEIRVLFNSIWPFKGKHCFSKSFTVQLFSLSITSSKTEGPHFPLSLLLLFPYSGLILVPLLPLFLVLFPHFAYLQKTITL